MNRINTVLSDLDGTIVLPNMQVTAEVRESIRDLYRNNVHLMPVTGRDYYDIREVAIASGIHGVGVYSGGSTIMETASGKQLWRATIELGLGREVLSKVCSFAEIVGYGQGRIAAESHAVNLEEPPLGLWVEFQDDRLDEAKAIRELYPELTFHFSTYQNDGTLGLHITPEGVDKAITTLKVLDLLGLDSTDTLAIGDGQNDLPLFAISAISVAMGNAETIVKEAATHTTESVDDNGFANAMYRYVI